MRIRGLDRCGVNYAYSMGSVHRQVNADRRQSPTARSPCAESIEIGGYTAMGASAGYGLINSAAGHSQNQYTLGGYGCILRPREIRWGYWHPPIASPTSAPRCASAKSCRFHWPSGTSWHYSFAVHSTNRAHGPDASKLTATTSGPQKTKWIHEDSSFEFRGVAFRSHWRPTLHVR